jgi:hypothetical protein
VTSPRDSAAINQKIETGRVTADMRLSTLVHKKEDFAKTPTEKPKKEKKEKPKPKAKEKKAKKEVKFPVEAFINGYGFLRLSKSLLDSWGWKPGKGNRTLVSLDMQDGALIVKKKAA